MQTILIVDDEFGLAETLSDVLVTMGYDVTTAVNGRLALGAVVEKRPDAVLLDMMMPVMTGPEMLAVLKADETYRDIPVILMSAAAPETMLVELRPMIADFLQKPFTLERLMAALHKCFGSSAD
ncbi:MAG TPA: response regulator [Polyangiaceae bacterium]|nr:response regulator [Polyangiaceae bacterium]